MREKKLLKNMQNILVVMTIFILMCGKKNDADTTDSLKIDGQDFPSIVLAKASKTLPDSLAKKAKDEIAIAYKSAVLVLYATVSDTFHSLQSTNKDQGWKVAILKDLKIMKGKISSNEIYVSGLGGLSPTVRDPAIFSRNEHVKKDDKLVCFLSINMQLSKWTGSNVYSCLKFVILK